MKAEAIKLKKEIDISVIEELAWDLNYMIAEEERPSFALEFERLRQSRN